MTKDMTTGSPLRMILLFSVPVLLGNIFQQFYNMVDTIIVGQYLGEDALAAVGSTGCLMFLVLGFANGIAQGFGVMVSHAFGAKDFKLLKHYVALSLILTAIVSLLLTIPTVAASRQFLIFNENTGQYLRTRRLLYQSHFRRYPAHDVLQRCLWYFKRDRRQQNAAVFPDSLFLFKYCA